MGAAGVRARVRAELTREITDAARRQLASDGAAALSLRAVARELGMASSAVYRYFPSRDDLLTTLIVDAYDALGAAAEQAEGTVDRADLRGRWRAGCRAVRGWALAHPHEYALVYGSPVPGYAAPASTVAPAGRVGELLCRIVADGIAAGSVDPAAASGDADSALVPGMAERVGLPADPGSSVADRAVQAWSSLFGLVNFELFGHTHNVVADHARFFDDAVDSLATRLGLPAP
jgi:AcrR family transcriptional regulator